MCRRVRQGSERKKKKGVRISDNLVAFYSLVTALLFQGLARLYSTIPERQLNDALVRVFKLLPFILLIILYIGVTSLKCVLNAKVSEKWVLDGGRHLCQLILDCLYIFAVA